MLGYSLEAEGIVVKGTSTVKRGENYLQIRITLVSRMLEYEFAVDELIKHLHMQKNKSTFLRKGMAKTSMRN